MHKKISYICLLLGVISIVYFIYQKANYKVDVKLIVVGGNNQILEARRGYLEEEPIAPDIEGYTFNHWEYNGEEYTIDTKLTEDAELVGVYDKNIVFYNVTFKYDNGSKDSVYVIEENNKVPKPTDPKKNGYTFKGWYLNDKFFNFDNPITSDITLVAKYNKNVVVNTTKYSNTENKRKVCLALKSNGLSNNAVASIMANIVYETGFNPNLYGCGGQCYGLVQWYKGRFTKLKNYCGANYTTSECQVKYLMNELNGGYRNAKNALNSGQDVVTMTYNFCKYFEVPANLETTCKNRANGQAKNMLSYVNNGCQ